MQLAARLALALLATMLVFWIGLLVVIVVTRPRGLKASEMALLAPEALRLATRLARDPAVPRRIRLRLWLLVAFMASPIDLLPDFIPVIGFADDVILAYLVFRSVVRAAGSETLTRNWPGTPEGLDTLFKLLKLENL